MKWSTFPIALASFVLALAPARARASCAPVPGDLDGSGLMNVVDVQCGILSVLWSMGGLGLSPACLAGSDVKLADVSCDGATNVVDVQMLILLALDLPLISQLDADADGCVDACQVVRLDPRWAWVSGGSTLPSSDNYTLRAVVGQWVIPTPSEGGGKTLAPGVKP